MDNTDTPPPAEPMPELKLAVPANTPTLIQPGVCSKAETQRVVCWLRDRVAKDPETLSYKSFSSAGLELNIVGVRKKDSIDDKFDDFMVLFFRPVTADKKAEFEKLLEQAFRDDWKDIFGKASKVTRMVECSQPPGTWVVAKYEISTDPGLTDYPEEGAAKEVAKTENNIKKKKEAVAQKKKELDDAKTDLIAKQEAAKKEETALAEKRAANAGAAQPASAKAAKTAKAAEEAPLAAANKNVEKATKSVEKANKAFEQANTELETEKGNLAKNQEKLLKAVEDAAKRDPIGVIGDGIEGGLEVGRGMLPCGVYTGDESYVYGRHHGPSAEHFRTAHVALTVNMFAKCYRFYSVKVVKGAHWIALAHGVPATATTKAERPKHKLRQKTFPGKDKDTPGETRFVVCEHFPAGARSNGRKFAGETATLVETEKTDGTRDVSIAVEGDGPVSLGDDDVLAMWATDGGGMNLHRAHNTGLGSNGKVELVDYYLDGKGQKVTYAQSNVKTWSEGCQVNPTFDNYNLFLRIVEASKRWRCAQAHANPVDPGCAVLKAGSGDTYGPGERCLLDTPTWSGGGLMAGERFINLASLPDIAKEISALKVQIALFENRKAHAWSDARTKELDGLHDQKTTTTEQKRQIQVLEQDKKKNLAWDEEVDGPMLDALNARHTLLVKAAEGVGDAVENLKKKQDLEAEVEKHEAEMKKADAVIEKNDAEAQKHVAKIAELDAKAQALEATIAAATAPGAQHKDLTKPKADLAAANAAKKSEEGKRDAALAAKQKGVDARKTAEAAKKKAEGEIELINKHGLDGDALKRRNEFLRERTRYFGADFLRECDVRGACSVRFNYVLVEFDDDALSELDKRFKKGKDWSGNLAFEAAP